MTKLEEFKPKTSNYIYNFNFHMFNVSGFGILENPKKWQKRLYSIYHVIIHSLYLSFICMFFIDAYEKRDDLEKLNLNLCVTILTTGSVVKIWSLMPNLKMILELRRKYRENFNLPHVGQDEAHGELLEKYSRQLLLVTQSFYSVAIPVVFLWITFPLVDPTSKERRFCIPFPIVKDKKSPLFELSYALHAFMLAHFALNIMNNDLQIIGFLIGICGHFEVLKYNISKIKNVYPQPEFEKYIEGYESAKSDGDDEKRLSMFYGGDECDIDKARKTGLDYEYFEKLKKDKKWQKRETLKLMSQNVVHHRCILQQLEDVNYVYGGQLFIQVTVGALVLSVIAFDVIVQSRKFGAPVIQQLLYVGGVALDIFVLCYYGSVIEKKSEEIAEALYDTPWHDMDSSCQKICSFMIAKCRKHRPFRARYVFKVDLDTYQSLVKTSYNVMAVLKETA